MARLSKRLWGRTSLKAAAKEANLEVLDKLRSERLPNNEALQ